MKRFLTLILSVSLLFACAMALPAETGKATTAAAPATSATAPTVSEVDQLKLKVLVQDLTIKQLQYQASQQAAQQLQSDYQKVQADLQLLVTDVYKKNGVTKDGYDLNLQTFLFSKKTATK